MTDKPGRKIHGDEVLELLETLGSRLEERGCTAELYVGGGAAMSLLFAARDVTDDVDALGAAEKHVQEIAREIADEHGLQAGWLNGSFSSFVPSEEADDDAEIRRFGGLTVRIASPQFLLAMKMHASRPKDADDIYLLLGKLSLYTARQVADLTMRLYGDVSVPPVTHADIMLDANRYLRVLRSRDPLRPADPEFSP